MRGDKQLPPLSPSRPFWQVGLRWVYGWVSLTKSTTAWLHSNRYSSPQPARQRRNMEKQLHLQHWRDTEAFRLTSSIGTCWVHVTPPHVTRTSGLKRQQRQWKTVWHVRNNLEVCLKDCTSIDEEFQRVVRCFLALIQIESIIESLLNFCESSLLYSAPL